MNEQGSGNRSQVTGNRSQLSTVSPPLRLCSANTGISATVLILLFVSLSFPALPQKSSKAAPSASYKLISLKVTGTHQYTEKEILPAAGLELGQNVTEADFKEAVRRLGDSGLFADISYSFAFSSAGMRLELQVTDADPAQLVPAHFENFVWFTDAELERELQTRVPLFKQQLPLGGAMADRVEAALQALLDERLIPGRVDYIRESDPNSEKMTGIAFSVEAMQIRVKELEFPGATPDLVPGLNKASRKIVGSPYLRSPLGRVAEVEFVPVCWKLGYLKAKFERATARVLSQEEGEIHVAAAIPVLPGKVYSAAAVTWAGNTVVKTNDLQNFIHLVIGQPADAVRLQDDLHEAEKLYHTRGYMLARVTPTPAFDDDKSTVAYTLSVDEGEQFKMGELEIVGLDSQAKAQLQSEWKMAEGDPYNGEYAKQFLEKTTQLLPRGVPWSATIHEAVNEKDKTVDITLRFTAR